MNYDNRSYIIFNANEVDKVDFNQVLETSRETLRKSVDDSKTFVKWDSGADPSFVTELSTKEGPYNHEEMLSILSGEDWVHPHTM